MSMKICSICDKEFEQKRCTQIYCCRKCLQTSKNIKARLKDISRVCKICGTHFEFSYRYQKCCSDSCIKENKRLTHTKANKNYYSSQKGVDNYLQYRLENKEHIAERCKNYRKGNSEHLKIKNKE